MNKANVSVSLFAALVGCSLAFSPRHAGAEEYVKYRAKPVGSTVKLEGSSNIHDWIMEGTIIGGYLEVPASVKLDPAEAVLPGAPDGKVKARAEVSIPVTSVRSPKYTDMDNVMQAAMGAGDFPRIIYHLDEMTLKQPHAAGAPLEFDTKGELSFHGVTNQITMPVTIVAEPGNKLKVSATVDLKMTDYAVKPPVKLGVFITEPGVKVHFDWVIGVPVKK